MNNLSLYSYWISSSHNTYLPYGQVFDPTNVCYYRLLSLVYFGGCFEIDTYSIKSDGTEVYISHLASNRSQITLSSILRTIVSAIKEKISQKIVSGPFILTFDNKKLLTKREHMAFWNVIERELLNSENYRFIQEIDDSFDLTQIPISKLSNKILIRWNENDQCNRMTNLDAKVGKALCPPEFKNSEFNFAKSPKSWVHLRKGDHKFEEEITQTKNESLSLSMPFHDGKIKKLETYNTNKNINKIMNKNIDTNTNVIVNTQTNLMRVYPHMLNTMSQNFNNMPHFRNGVQVVALNLQYLSNSWFLNRAVFMPPTGLPCSPNDKCDHGWKLRGVEKGSKFSGSTFDHEYQNRSPMAYRLKPLWLLGLVPHPGFYQLKIKVVSVDKITVDQNEKLGFTNVMDEYHDLRIMYGLSGETKKTHSSNVVKFENIDVSVPFFVVELHRLLSNYKSALCFLVISIHF